MGNRINLFSLGSAILCISGMAVIASPVPIAPSVTTVSYQTASGPVSFSASRDYSGRTPSDATILDGAPNIKSFNSANRFGRRTELAASHPNYAHIIGPNETLLAHTFFKIDNGTDYFPGIVEGSDVTISVDNIRFSEPVTVLSNTVLFHTLWRGEQADLLPHPYHHLHNLHTQSASFRNDAEFHAGGLFGDFPEPNYALSTVLPKFTGSGTDTLRLTLTIPYELLKNLEEEGHSHPPHGLPAPHGFLEPFHFHLEYLVTPGPACSRHADCDDGNVCTTDRCDKIAGTCHYLNNRKPCNDGLFCTKPDVCSDGVCTGSPRRCPVNEACNEDQDRCVAGR